MAAGKSCKYCTDGIWISPISGNKYTCEECPTVTTANTVQSSDTDYTIYDAGSGIADNWGGKRWRLNGERHRIGGPAVEGSSGYESWWLHGKRHRTNGPAITYPDGTHDWYLNDIHFENEEDWQQEVDKLAA